MRMFSAIRGRLRISPATVIAVVALVLAMSGGAYAAGRYLITSTKQISPKVLKALAGKPGKAGANGAQGPGGPAGAQGPAGPQGPAGAAGAKGEAGAPGQEGKQGAPGTTGFTETLPSGKTETGVWTDQIPQGSQALGLSSISFMIPLASGLEENHVFFVEPQAAAPEQCPGTVAHPKATPGNLCVYARVMAGLVAPSIQVIHDPSSEQTFGVGAARTGAFLTLGLEENTESGSAWGTWAVTAP